MAKKPPSSKAMDNPEVSFTVSLFDDLPCKGSRSHYIAIACEAVLVNKKAWMVRYSVVRVTGNQRNALDEGARGPAPFPVPGKLIAQGFESNDSLVTTYDTMNSLRKKAYEAAGGCALQVCDSILTARGVVAVVGERYGSLLNMFLIEVTQERFDMLVRGDLVIGELESAETIDCGGPAFYSADERKEALNELQEHEVWQTAKRIAHSEHEAEVLKRALNEQTSGSGARSKRRV